VTPHDEIDEFVRRMEWLPDVPAELILEHMKAEFQRSGVAANQRHACQYRRSRGRRQCAGAARLSDTTYARINESGKNTRLRRKYRRKLCPFRLATLAGQNAIAIQMMKSKIEPSHQPTDIASTPASLWVGGAVCAAAAMQYKVFGSQTAKVHRSQRRALSPRNSAATAEGAGAPRSPNMSVVHRDIAKDCALAVR
jgi:hypothetical protein